MNFQFEIEDVNKIKNKLGSNFYSSINKVINLLMSRWGIIELDLIKSFSSNIIFKGVSKDFKSVIIKVFSNKDEFIGEVNALNFFDESLFCKLLDVDYANLALLEEMVLPGTQLAKEKNIKTRLNVFCDLYKQLHYKSNKESLQFNENDIFYFNSYRDWIYRITEYMCGQDNWNEFADYMLRAKKLYLDLSQTYTEKCLLHGDLHYYNILKAKNGYIMIDPKGVIGNPIFDTSRYMLNEFWDNKNSIKIDEIMDTVFGILSSNLCISRKVLSELLYIEGVMGVCWFIQSGANIKEKAKYLHDINKLLFYMSSNYK